ncbi:MAG TPA: family 10 glycosylhydrolase, partial [Gemmatimonadaceae bacterium]
NRDTLSARTHVSRSNPSLVRSYDQYLWMDPGDPEVRRRSVRVIVDVAKRYDVDGVHIDDYFYPYPVNNSAGRRVEFPDSVTYARYVKAGGKLAKDDWRRENVDKLVEALYKGVHEVKPWVKVGISPFGIWRPGNPPQVSGFDAFAELYADARKWMQRGWADYMAPQLYWPISRPQQSFPVLLDWWLKENTKKRHVWPGLATYRILDSSAARHISAQEIVDEIDSTRVRPGSQGHIHFSMTVLMKNPDSLFEKLSARYAESALVPASPWLGATPPGKPIVSLGHSAATGEPFISLAPAKGGTAWLWVVRTRVGGAWSHQVLPGWLRVHRLPDDVQMASVTAISRTGIEGPATTVLSGR